MDERYHRLWILFKSRIAKESKKEETYTSRKDVFAEVLAEMDILEADVMLGE